MAEKDQITVEDLSPTPIQPVAPEEETPEVPVEAQQEELPGQPQPGETGFVVPPRPVVTEDIAGEIQARQPGVQVEILPGDFDPNAVVEDVEEQTGRPLEAPMFETAQQPIAAGPALTPEPTTIDGAPILPPARFEDRASDPNLTDEEFLAIKKETADFYRTQVLGGNGDPEKRMEAINRASFYRIPLVDPNGQAVVDENGRIVYDSQPIPFISDDPEMRLIQLFELARSNNGFYHFFEGDANDPEAQTFGQLDIGLQKMLRGNQNPLASFFYRVESEQGGMRNYVGILKDTGINDPARLTVMARQQAQAGPFTGLEMVRMGAGIRDTVKFLADIGFGDGFQIPGTEVRLGLGAPLQDFTASIPFYLYEAASLERWNPFSEATPYQDIIASDVPKRIRQITQGNIAPWQMDDAVTVLKREYPHATETQIEALLAYSPDLLTLTKRWTAESLVTGAGVLTFMRGLAKAERSKFIDHVRDLAGDDTVEINDLADAMLRLEEKGLDVGTVVREYYEKQGLSGAASQILAKSFDQELQMAARRPGPFFDKVIEPKLNDAKDRLATIDKKLDAALEKGNEDLIKSLSAQKQLLQKEVLDFKEQTYVPSYMRDYVRDEAIATGVAATAYQFVYDVAGENPTTASIAAFAFGVTSAVPGVRDIAANGVEDIKLALSSNLKSDQSKAAIRIRRHLEKAPRELRDHILQFMERRAIAVEELSQLKFPVGHPRAGEPVIAPGLLDQSFAQMSGLVSLRRLEGEITKASIDIQKDAGRLSQNLLDLEKNYIQQSKLIDALGQSMDALRYYRFSDQFDPSSESGQMTGFLIDFYQASLDDLTTRRNRLTDALDKRDTDMQMFYNGTMDIDQLEGYLDGTDSLAQLLSLDRARYAELNMTPDMTPAEQAERLQTYFVGLNTRVAEAFEANNRFTFDADLNSTTANRDFRSFITTMEAQAYQQASQKFNDLRSNVLYQDLRMDMTDVLEAFATQGPNGALGINTQAISQFVPIYGQGTQASRTLAKKNIDPSTNRALVALFGEAAGEYLDDFGKKVGQETLNSIYAKAEIDDDATNIDRWYAVRDWFEANKGKFGDEYKDLEPRLGVDPATFMHVVSGLGKSGARPDAIAHRQLRADLLNRAESEFYDNFYEPKSARTSNSSFVEEYKQAREYYKSRYLTPFREESSTVARLVRNPDTKIQRNALDSLMKELGAADPGVDLPKLRENFYEAMEGIIGGPIDVTTPEGRAIKAILTKHVQAEIARTPGASALRNYLALNYTQETGRSLIIPKEFKEIEQALQEGGTPLLDNLLRRDARDGKYLFSDVNGEPLVDISMSNPVSFDDLLGYGVREAETAMVTNNNYIATERKLLVREFDQLDSRIRREVDARKALTQGLRASKQGLGSALIDLTGRDGGLEDLAQVRQDYIYAQSVDGNMSADEAGALFDDVVRDATLDHIMTQIMDPGAEMPMKTIDPTTGEQRMIVQRGVELNLNNLASILGIRGDTVSEAPQAKAMRALLGKNTVDHMKFVFETLFQYDPRTGALNVTGTSVPLSAESMLSRGTSFFRGVISLRWLISEAAIRSARESNYQLTKLMLGDPQVGREVLDMVMKKDFNLDRREPEFIPVLISQIAKFDALQEIALRESQESPTDTQMQALPQADDQPQSATGVDQQMNSLFISP